MQKHIISISYLLEQLVCQKYPQHFLSTSMAFVIGPEHQLSFCGTFYVWSEIHHAGKPFSLPQPAAAHVIQVDASFPVFSFGRYEFSHYMSEELD